MDKNRASFTWVDWLLVAAIAGLSIQLLVIVVGPTFEAWKNRPRPGVQVPQQCIVEHGSGEYTMSIPIDYLVYLPPNYTSQKKWPLVVYLHGAGSRGTDLGLVRREWLPDQAAQGKPFNFILVSPQCPKNSAWLPEHVVKLTEHVSRSLSVDRDRVYLTGYSMGGFGTWATASHDPGRFAAIAPLCGGGDAGQAERLKNVPIWAFHGDKDDVVSVKESREMVEAVRKCGGQVQLTVYPGVGHDISEMTYQDGQFYEWLLAQRRTALSAKSFPELFETCKCSFTDEQQQQRVCKYQIFVPRAMEPSESYPLLVWPVFGDWLNQLVFTDGQHPEKYRFFVLVVESADNFDHILQDVVRRYPVDQNRVTVSAPSRGGGVCWEIGLRHAELVAAIAPLGAGRSDIARVANLASMPIWVFHSRDETYVPRFGAEEMVAAVKGAGGNAHLTLIPSNSHDCWTSAINDYSVLPWLLEQRRGDLCWSPPGFGPWRWWHVVTLPCAFLVFVRLVWCIEQKRRRKALNVATSSAYAAEPDFSIASVFPGFQMAAPHVANPEKADSPRRS